MFSNESIEQLKNKIIELEDELDFTLRFDTYGGKTVVNKIQNEIQYHQKDIDFIELILSYKDIQ